MTDDERTLELVARLVANLDERGLPHALVDRITALCARFGLSGAWAAVLPEVTARRS